MVSQTHIYRRAQRLIDHSGSEAAELAYGMLLRSLEADNLPDAGDWLAIGQAIENLQNLPPAGRRH
jgi:hypothetical protein